MGEMHLPWLEVAVLLPLVGAIVVARIRDRERAQQRALMFSGLALLCAIGAWIDFAWLHKPRAHDHWSVIRYLFNYWPFAIDELSAPLLPMGALVYFLTMLATVRTKARRFSFSWTLISESILLATFSCLHPWGIVALLSISVVPPLWELHVR